LARSVHGTFAAKVEYAAGDESRSIVAIDIDGNGDLDLATANTNSGDVSLLINPGEGTVVAAQPLSTAGQ
jgi:hypothetical protein